MAKTAPRSGQAAVTYAKSWIGKPYPPGWCQKWTNEVFGTGPVGDYDGDRAADAEDGWKKAVDKGKVVRAADIKNLADIPAATMLYWSGGRAGHGHAAVSAGGGQKITTDLPTTGKIGMVPITKAHDVWGLTFLGYVLVEGNGHDLGAFTPAVKTGIHYRVNTRAGLYARKTPNGPNVVRNGKKLIRPLGFDVRVINTATAGGRKWSQGAGGLWYASDYLSRK